MIKLTDSQILFILQLGNHPSVEYADISVHSGGNTYATISTKADADMVEVIDELCLMFPTVDIGKNPFHIDRDDGTCNDLYTIGVGVGDISLHIISNQKEKPSAPTESIKELSQPDYNEMEVIAQ